MSAARQAREAAISFECVKVKLAQSKDGILLTFSVHPDEVPDSLVRAFVGSRWLAALVRLGDDDQPVADPKQVEADRMVQSAAMLCRDTSFQAFLVRRRIATEATEVAAAEGLRAYLGVNSRADLKSDNAARRLFEDLREAFRRA